MQQRVDIPLDIQSIEDTVIVEITAEVRRLFRSPSATLPVAVEIGTNKSDIRIRCGDEPVVDSKCSDFSATSGRAVD